MSAHSPLISALRQAASEKDSPEKASVQPSWLMMQAARELEGREIEIRLMEERITAMEKIMVRQDKVIADLELKVRRGRV
jgi:hypothetical protein